MHADSEFLLREGEEEDEEEEDDNPLGKDDIQSRRCLSFHFPFCSAQLEFETVQALMEFISDKERNLEEGSQPPYCTVYTKCTHNVHTVLIFLADFWDIFDQYK